MAGCRAGIDYGKYKLFHPLNDKLVPMERNSFYCSDCEKYTPHIELSAREFSAQLGWSKLSQALGAIYDHSGVTKVVTNLVGRKFWKCCECGLVTRRNNIGEEV